MKGGAEALALLLLRPSRLDYLVNLPGSKGVGSVALRFLTEDAQHFRFRRGQLDVVANAQEHGLGRAALLDD